MKLLLLIYLTTITLLINSSAYALINNDVSLIDISDELEQTQTKPWSFNMGISNLDAAADFPNTEPSTVAKQGKGVTVSLQRNLTKQFELGMSFTSYKITNQNLRSYYYSQKTMESYANVTEIYGEIQPIQFSMYNGSNFTARAFTGIATRFDSNSKSTLLYGISAGLDFKRKVGIRFDIKTLISWGNINSLSMIGYF